MKKLIKFYQTIIPIILSIMYSATIFGTDDPASIILTAYNDDQLMQISTKLGSIYKKTGHIKPYSRSLNFLTNYADFARSDKNIFSNLAFSTLSTLSLASLTSLIPNNIRLRSILSDKVKPRLIFLLFTIANMALGKTLANSHLITNNPRVIQISEMVPNIFIIAGQLRHSKQPSLETRYLSNMKLNKEETLRFPSGDIALNKKITGTRLIYELEEFTKDNYQYKKVNIYLPPIKVPVGERILRVDSLPLNATPTTPKIISFDVSKNEQTIVTLDEKGNVHKWELLELDYVKEEMEGKWRAR